MSLEKIQYQTRYIGKQKFLVQIINIAEKGNSIKNMSFYWVIAEIDIENV